jgi:glyoxylase-like metal-dependent hydrolase (beta-lactamase superfamily II)
MNTPGHTKGSICIVMGDVIFTGDTLFAGTCGRCDLPGGDYEEMLASLKRIGELDGDYTLYPGHGEPTTIGYEKKANPFV